MPCCGSKEVEMVVSLTRVNVFAIRFWKEFSVFEMLDAKIASALNKIIQNFQDQDEGQS